MGLGLPLTKWSFQTAISKIYLHVLICPLSSYYSRCSLVSLWSILVLAFMVIDCPCFSSGCPVSLSQQPLLALPQLHYIKCLRSGPLPFLIHLFLPPPTSPASVTFFVSITEIYEYLLVSNKTYLKIWILWTLGLYRQIYVLDLYLCASWASQLHMYTTLFPLPFRLVSFWVFYMLLSVRTSCSMPTKRQNKTKPFFPQKALCNLLDIFLSFTPPTSRYTFRKMFWFYL